MIFPLHQSKPKSSLAHRKEKKAIPIHPALTRRPNAKKSLSQKQLTYRARRYLLKQLREERAQLVGYRFGKADAPELYALAKEASVANGRFVRYKGVRFPMRFGFWRYVLDPETGECLVAADGGWL